MTTILRIDGSARRSESVTRQLTDQVINRLVDANPGAVVATRDLLSGIPLLDPASLTGLAMSSDEYNSAQAAALAQSDQLLEEFLAADIIVIAAPIYNFSVPAAVKAYVDQIVRAGRTFHYTENGAAGLVTDRPAYIVSASGGVPFGSEVDFATPYLRAVLGFMGITSVELIGADALIADPEAAMARAQAQLDSVLPVVAAAI